MHQHNIVVHFTVNLISKQLFSNYPHHLHDCFSLSRSPSVIKTHLDEVQSLSLKELSVVSVFVERGIQAPLCEPFNLNFICSVNITNILHYLTVFVYNTKF